MKRKEHDENAQRDGWLGKNRRRKSCIHLGAVLCKVRPLLTLRDRVSCQSGKLRWYRVCLTPLERGVFYLEEGLEHEVI